MPVGKPAIEDKERGQWHPERTGVVGIKRARRFLTRSIHLGVLASGDDPRVGPWWLSYVMSIQKETTTVINQVVNIFPAPEESKSLQY